MSTHEIIVAGFGGQGIMSAGHLLIHAGLRQGLNVTFFPSYGPEMRGGTAYSMVVISENEIGSPIVRRPTGLVVMNDLSMAKFSPWVREGGVIVANSSQTQASTGRVDVREARVPAVEIAEGLGAARVAAMVLVGRLARETGAVGIDSLKSTLSEILPSRHQHLVETNQRALQAGYDSVG